MSGRENLKIAADRFLEALKTSSPGDLFALLPQISVLRDARFFDPLHEMLLHSDRVKHEFAATGLGALKDVRAIVPLSQRLTQRLNGESSTGQPLPLVIVQALGEIGSDHATPYLKNALDREINPADRAAWIHNVIDSLGKISQQGGGMALETLMALANGEDTGLCLPAIPEIAVAFWHKPKAVPSAVVQLLDDLLDDEIPAVRSAASSALENLADLGCGEAEHALTHRD